MDLLVDLFGYLSIIVHGLTILSQSMALGGVLYLVFLARPLAARLGQGPASVSPPAPRASLATPRSRCCCRRQLRSRCRPRC